MAIVACGQNPSVTQDDGKDTESTRQESQGPDVPAAEPRLSDVPGPRGENGQDGVDGQNGRDGCAVRPLTVTFPARVLKREETRAITMLPYVSTPNHRIASNRHVIRNLPIGIASGRTHNVPYVADSQVLFAIDVVSLPPRKAIRELTQALLKIEVSKIERDQFKSTELLCLIDERICSGYVYEASNWQDNINDAFFRLEGGPSNTYFAGAYLDRSMEKVDNHNHYAAELVLPLEEILHGSGVQDPLHLIYGLQRDDQRLDLRTLKFVVADDTYVSKAELSLTLVEDQCVTAELKEGSSQ
jgi:hypothetical protein